MKLLNAIPPEEAATGGVLIKKLFWKISLCWSLWNLRNFSEHLFWRTSASDCFCPPDISCKVGKWYFSKLEKETFYNHIFQKTLKMGKFSNFRVSGGGVIAFKKGEMRELDFANCDQFLIIRIFRLSNICNLCFVYCLVLRISRYYY